MAVPLSSAPLPAPPPPHRCVQVDAATRRLVEQPSRVVLQGYKSPMQDAAAERGQATFDSEELAAFLHEGEDKLLRRCVCACRGVAAGCTHALLLLWWLGLAGAPPSALPSAA